MRYLDDLYRRRNELAFQIEHGYPHYLTDYTAMQMLILEEEKRWASEYEERIWDNLRRYAAIATEQPVAHYHPVWDGETI